MKKIHKLSVFLSSVFLFTLNPSYAEYKLEKIEAKENISFLEKLFKKFNFCSSVSQKYDKWVKGQILICRGEPVPLYNEDSSENYCERTPGEYVKVNLLGEKDNLLIDIVSSCIPRSNNYGFFLLLENNNCYIIPRAGEAVEFLGKIINTNDKKESLLIRGMKMSSGAISDYILKCYIRENKFVCKDIINAGDYEAVEIGEKSPISVSLDRINLDGNYLNIRGKIIEVNRKYSFKARFNFNQETGDFLLKEVLINKQLISVLAKKEFPANDYLKSLKNNPEFKEVLDKAIKKHKIQLKDSIINKINIFYINKQYTVILLQDKNYLYNSYATIAISNNAQNPKLYKLYRDAMIFSGEKNLPEAVKAALLFFHNISLRDREDSDDIVRTTCINK